MSHLHVTPAALDHLTLLLRRTTGPAPPALPPGSRTAAALDRAGASWAWAFREADSSLHDHVREVTRFTATVTGTDADLARRIGGR